MVRIFLQGSIKELEEKLREVLSSELEEEVEIDYAIPTINDLRLVLEDKTVRDLLLSRIRQGYYNAIVVVPNDVEYALYGSLRLDNTAVNKQISSYLRAILQGSRRLKIPVVAVGNIEFRYEKKPVIRAVESCFSEQYISKGLGDRSFYLNMSEKPAFNEGLKKLAKLIKESYSREELVGIR